MGADLLARRTATATNGPGHERCQGDARGRPPGSTGGAGELAQQRVKRPALLRA
jgi:hypothetical protein